MKKFIFALFAPLILVSCDKIHFTDSSKPAENAAPEEKKGEKVVANFDVDLAATEKFRSEILAQFPEGANGADVEKAYAAKGFECGADPVSKTDRACTNAVTKDKCVIMSIVRTQPYTPNSAQIITACGMVN